MPANTIFDAIVVGVGTMGSSTCYYLSKRGYKVLGIDQFDVPHEQGSHTGQSRIIRKAYFEHPDYVPLLDRAYQLWQEFEKETATKFYYPTGLLYAGTVGCEMIEGVKLSASLYNIPIENIDPVSARNRFPQFEFPPDFEILFEADAGFVTPERAIANYKDYAEKNGAIISTREKVLEWRLQGDKIAVITDHATYYSHKLIITAGAWAGKVIAQLAGKITVTRQFIAWMNPKNEQGFSLNEFPCWMIADNTKPGCYYGFPTLPTSTFGQPAGLKMAHHFPGEATDPDHVNPETRQEDLRDMAYLIDHYFKDQFGAPASTKTCLYANSPDENFIIDKLPGYNDSVFVACGFSGHGFKFMPVVGEILADLAMEGKSKLPIGFLSATRFNVIS